MKILYLKFVLVVSRCSMIKSPFKYSQLGKIELLKTSKIYKFILYDFGLKLNCENPLYVSLELFFKCWVV